MLPHICGSDGTRTGNLLRERMRAPAVGLYEFLFRFGWLVRLANRRHEFRLSAKITGKPFGFFPKGRCHENVTVVVDN
jgi:hypothetical protein